MLCEGGGADLGVQKMLAALKGILRPRFRSGALGVVFIPLVIQLTRHLIIQWIGFIRDDLF